MSKVYFPNLNGLRFIAASVVIIHHVEQFKDLFGTPNYSKNAFVEIIGKLGVMLFFVLSGFLITYLLLVEEKQKGGISIRKFYIRRALRIWPLYFLILLLAFFIVPEIPFFHVPVFSAQLQDHFWIKVALYVFFLPNLVLGLFPIVPYASQSWSIGYEEQFYLVWPLLIKKIKNRYIIFGSIILVFIVLQFLAFYVFEDFLMRKNYHKIAVFFFRMPGIDCMAIGGAFAYMLYQKSPLLEKLYSKTFQWLLYLTVFALTFNGIFIPFFNNQVYSLLFGIMIVNLAANPKSIINLENKTFDYLGKISYGIYMYHMLMIAVVLKLFGMLGIHNIVLENFLAISLTVIIAGISYKYLEERFIKIKSKF